jgi:hypothetical protein
MSARFYVGDAFDVMATLSDNSVDLLMTSPPFLALRSYLPADHPDKGKEIGSEANPAAFVDTLLRLTAEWDRLLAPHGSLCVELGDTYAGQDTRNGSIAPDPKMPNRPGVRTAVSKAGGSWPLDKSLALVPELYRIALAYGLNPLTGQESPAGRWRVRNVVRWHRPNPPVGALGDKFRPSTSDLVVACRARDRYFDLDAVREPYSANTNARTAKGVTSRPNSDKSADDDRRGGNFSTLDVVNNDGAGAPPLDTWVIPTAPYAGAHYATFPPQLCVRPVKAMCPERVCRVCGLPSRRITEAFTLDSYRVSTRPQTIKAVRLADEHGLTDEHIAAVRAFGTSDAGQATILNNGAGKNTDEVKTLAAEAKAVLGGYFREFVMSTTAERQSSWSDCGHNDYRPGLTLDPFAGSGTTLMVATGHGRDAIGIDLDHRNLELARQRLGMFLEEVA